MLIASRFKRPKAPIELGDKTYFFTPVNPADPESVHVCDVTDNSHIGRLLGVPEGYYLPEDHEVAFAAPVATKPVASIPPEPQRPVEVAKPAEVPADPPSANGVEVAALPEEQAEAARNLIELSWQKLKSVLKEGGIAPAVIAEALRIEKAKPEEDQQSTKVKVLSQALEAL